MTVTGRGEHDTETRVRRPWWTEGQVVYMGEPSLFAAAASELAAEVIAKLHNDDAAAVRAEHGEHVLGTFRALIADEKALGDESFFYASLDDVADFVTEAAARLAREAQS